MLNSWLRQLVFIAGVALASACAAQTINPYLVGDPLAAAPLAESLTAIAAKLEAAGFTVIGRHQPKGIGTHGALVVTDDGILDAVRKVGGATVVGAAVRVGVSDQGVVTYMNPEYWYRAYFRDDYPKAEPAVSALTARLAGALGSNGGTGGKEDVEDLAEYRYMMGMERFDDDDNLLHTAASFDEAVRTIRANLAAGTGDTAQVYEIVMPEQQLAVFGVALNEPKRGEVWWVNKIGVDNVAALPYEIYVVGNTSNALYARYRLALSWPSLGMGTFMGISKAPGIIRDTLAEVAGATEDE
jgi:hypothetical protein